MSALQVGLDLIACIQQGVSRKTLEELGRAMGLTIEDTMAVVDWYGWEVQELDQFLIHSPEILTEKEIDISGLMPGSRDAVLSGYSNRPFTGFEILLIKR